MKSIDLQRALRATFSSAELEMPGWVNYSGLDVLKEQTGGFYVMGLNPAMDDSNVPLSKYVPEQSSSWSAFTDECWKKHPTGECSHVELTSFQVQMITLVRELQVPINKVFGTNAIFVATQDAEQITDLGGLWKRCWKVHQRFLMEMQPTMIICLGNGELGSAFALLKSVANGWTPILSPGGDSKKRWKAADAQLPLFCGEHLSVRVLGLPHPSYPHFAGGKLDANFREYQSAIAAV